MVSRAQWFFCLALAMLTSCSGTDTADKSSFRRDASAERVYTFAVHPLRSAPLLQKKYQPLIAYLNENMGGANRARTFL